MALVNERYPAPRLGENRAERELPNSVHRVNNDLETRAADHFEINEGFHGIDVIVREVTPPHDAPLQRDIEIDFDDLFEGEPVRLSLNLLRLVVKQQRTVATKYLEAVPIRWIVAGGEGQAISGLLYRGGVRDEGRRRVFAQQRHRDVVSREELRGCLAGAVGQKAPVLVGEHAQILIAPTRDRSEEHTSELQ